jgi:polysaccharide pyruvyl transferase WcaK-like protein
VETKQLQVSLFYSRVKGNGQGGRSKKSTALKDQKVALLGPFGFGNLGDAAIQQAMISGIRRVLPQSEIVGISLNPADTEKRHGIKCLPISRRPGEGGSMAENTSASPSRRVFKKRYHIIARIMLEFVIVWRSFINFRGFGYLIISGGGQLDDYWGGAFSHPYTLLKWTTIARLKGAKVCFVSVGAGPINSGMSVRFLKIALSLSHYRSFRDKESRALLARFGFDRDDPVYPDLAHSLVVPSGKKNENKDSIWVGIGPMPYFREGAWPEADPIVYESYIARLSEFIRWLIHTGASIRFLPGVVGADSDVIRDLIARFQDLDLHGRVVTNRIESVDDLLHELSETDVVVASRFHGVLLSHVAHKPVLALSYHPKVENLMGEMGHEEYCLSIDDFSVAQLKTTFEKMKVNRCTLSEQIQQKEAVYRTDLERQLHSVF